MTIGRIEIGIFEVGRRRQHHIATRHALGHRQLDADREQILATEPPAHPVLVRMHDDRVVVIDEQRAQRRVDVVIGKMATDVVDVEGARAGGDQIGPLQPGGRFWEGIARAQDDAAAAAELSEQRRERNRRPDAAAAVAAAFEPIAGRQHQRFRLGQPAREPADPVGPQPADGGGPLGRPFAGTAHERLEAQHMRGDEAIVERAHSLELDGNGPGEQNVGAGPQLQMEIRLPGNLGAQRVDDDEPAAGPTCPSDRADEVQVGDGRVVAPDHVQRRGLGQFRRTSGHRAIGAGPGLAAHPAA